jgi:hypothetical protein
VCSGQDAYAYRISILLKDSFNYLFRGLAKASIHHFHARIPKSSRYNFRSPVMAVKPRFCNNDPDFSFVHEKSLQCIDTIE